MVEVSKLSFCDGASKVIAKLMRYIVPIKVDFYKFVVYAVTTDDISKRFLSALRFVDVDEVVINVLVN